VILAGSLAHQHVFDQRHGQRLVLLGLVQIGHFGRAVGLGSAADGFRHQGLQRIPVFRDLAVLVHPDDVEGHHLIGTERGGIAPDVVHEDIVAVFEHADVFGGGSGLCQHRQQVDERLKPGRDEGVVLDVIGVRQFTHGIDVALQNGAQKRADNRLYGRASSAKAPVASKVAAAAAVRVFFILMVLSGCG
jgi:hypothetical protein